ncbi:glycosyltransferase [Hymenobacter sp. P5252]|uniref:Glycosyltransferase n=1 Tax=Hymenobacter terrestris TaxID=2748310 RepID=A0ABX2Q4Q5_9BACT|nr:glycosyltransferase [Hymenobacter terrestris]
MLEEYQQRYSEKIRLLLPADNIGVMANLMAVINACQGPYVALLEEDDCWTYPQKLQRQVDFLDANPEISLCIHDAELFWDDQHEPAYPHSQVKTQLQNGEAEFTHADIVRDGWFISTASIVFRRSSLPFLPNWLLNIFSGDYSLHLLISAAGKVKYLPTIMSGYRQHAGGISQQKYNPALVTRKISENGSYRQHFDQ